MSAQHRPWCDQDDVREGMTGRCAGDLLTAGSTGVWLTETECAPMVGLASSSEGVRMTLAEAAELRDHLDVLLGAVEDGFRP